MRVFKRIFEAIMLDVFFVQNTEGMRQAKGEDRTDEISGFYRDTCFKTYIRSAFAQRTKYKKNSAKNRRAMSLLL